jgi:hypothetical protein
MKPFRWTEGEVDPATEHFQLRWVPDVNAAGAGSRLLALVGIPIAQEFVVELIGPSDQASSREQFEEVHRELDFYLVVRGGPNPWAYAQHHCTTAANLHSHVRWAFSTGESREFEIIGPLSANRDQLAQFRSGGLRRDWAQRYPMLFTEHQVRRALNQRQNHYFEWRTAIELYDTYGCRSLQKYEFPSASRLKAGDVARLLGRDVHAWLNKRQRRRVVQCPDLLAFRPDMSDAQFYEVKGPSDSLRPEQKVFFAKLSVVTGRPVKIMKFSWRVASTDSR